MTRMTSPPFFATLAGLFFALLACSPAPAAEKAEQTELVKAVLDVSALQPGKTATAAIVFEVKPGFHAQSSIPTEDYLVPFRVNVEENPAFKAGKVVYPKGKRIPFTEPKELDVYEGKITLQVPIEVKKDAALGKLKIEGTLKYQVCDDNACFPPTTTPFTIETEVVAAEKVIEKTNQEIIAAAGPAAGPAGPQYSLLGGLGLAFVVGLAFNLVPCVLPVLPIKIMGFYEASHNKTSRSIALAASFSAGVIASFAVLGLLVVVLQVLKWGELFAKPWFPAVLALIMVVMALNMFGLFTINLPSGAYGFSPRHDTFFGNFLFGILTAALSTPCTFGLFVSVLAWSLTQPAWLGLLAIMTVGAGMASPYLLLSGFPQVARKFPRTGPWAEVMRQSMGFLLLVVAAFFAARWIDALIGDQNVWWVMFAIILAMGIFIVSRAVKYGKTPTALRVATVISVVLVGGALALALRLTYKPHDWKPYSAEALAAARAANRVVLVDFTASWCANCKTIEATVINDKVIVAETKKQNVLMLKADLSDQSAPGWALLRELKEQGIPLTAVYAPGTAEPARFPGFYKVEELRSTLAKAATGAGTTAMAAR